LTTLIILVVANDLEDADDVHDNHDSPATMWSKLTNALKSRHSTEEQHGDTLNKALDPTLSVFHPNEGASSSSIPQPSSPTSPSINPKRFVFKRLSRQPFKEYDGEKAQSSGSLRISAFSKKSRPQSNFNTVGSGTYAPSCQRS